VNDKLIHAAAGAVITLLAAFVLPLWMAFVIASGAGIGKEIYDYFYPATHTADGMDFLATGLGSLLMAITLVAL